MHINTNFTTIIGILLTSHPPKVKFEPYLTQRSKPSYEIQIFYFNIVMHLNTNILPSLVYVNLPSSKVKIENYPTQGQNHQVKNQVKEESI